MLAHASELAATPGEQWPMVKERQALEILAVRDGKIDIVDRRTYQWPSLPSSVNRISAPVIKFTPANIRRFAKTPVARRAINLIKGSLITLDWDVVPTEGGDGEASSDLKQRIKAVKNCLAHPNNADTWQTLIEIAVDDFCITGNMFLEPQLTPSPDRPFKLWNVDSSTIRIYPDWTESTPNKPRFAQFIGMLSDKGAIPFRDDELIFVRDNPSVDSPFGVGKMEIAFEEVVALVGARQMAGRAGADQTRRSWLWWESGNQQQNIEIVRRHLDNDIEGQSRINLMGGMAKPDVIEIEPTTDSDLLPGHQEMAIRMIGNAFDLSGMALGLERDVNRSTGEVLDDKDFRSAVVPVAIRFQSAFTSIIHRLLGYTDLEFKFLNLLDPDVATKLTYMTQLWNTNSITSNGINKEMGFPMIASPYADLTQFEQSLVLAEATAKLADSNAANASDRQQDAQSQMMQQQQEYEQQNAPAAGQQQAAASLKLKPLKLAPLKGLNKSAMLGSRLNAKQVAALSKSQLQAAMRKGDVTADAKLLAGQMEQQEPGILLQLAPDVIQYLEQLQEEQAQKDKGADVKPSPKTTQNQKLRFKKNLAKRISPQSKRSQQNKSL